MATKQEKLLELLKVANDGLSKEDFTAAFKVVVDLVKKLQASNKEVVDNLESKYSDRVDQLIKRLESTSLSSLGEIKEEVQAELAKIGEQVTARLNEVKDGKPGKDANVDEVVAKASSIAVQEVTALIPTTEAVLKEVETNLPQLGLPIRDALELLPDGEKLKIEAIQDLREKLDELERKIISTGKTIYVPTGGGGGGRTVYVYDLSNQLDGVTKTFSLPAFWRIIGIQSSSFPGAFRPTTDYTSDSGASTITFTSEINAAGTLATGQTLIIQYAV